MPTFDENRAALDDRNLVRKIQKVILVLAPTTVDLPASLYTAGSLIDLKAGGWLPVGMMSPDGITYGAEREVETVDAFGYSSSVRSDTVRVPRTIAFTPLETGRKHIYELRLGTDLTGVTQDPTTGEIVIDEPDLPVDQEYRLLALGSDGPAAENWILGRGYGRVKLANTAEEVWGGDGAVAPQLTLNVFTDDEIGTPVRHYLAGTGAVAHKVALGFTQATP
ncbi:major tail protein [Arthrobacter phage Bauer]|uniref:Major tail protein n=1 Tax=Arthrobacter phage Bauer TaxID=2985648 RepID=A0A9E7V2N0_9CAUD|nr:major tail protein [Arthrobacter phage Bauer]UYM26564.1 major tail protein [Arthrobacter phage Bauer]